MPTNTNIRLQATDELEQVPLQYIDAVEAAIHAEFEAENLRKEGTKWSSPMFHFARYLLSDEGFGDLSDLDLVNIVTKVLVFRSREQGAPPGVDPWEWNFPADFDFRDDLNYGDPKASFIECLQLVRYPASVLDRAVAIFKTQSPIFRSGISDKYDRFIFLCSILQKLRADEPVIIATEKFGEILDVSARMVTTYKRLAIRDGLLHEVQAANRAKRRAGEFRFDLALLQTRCPRLSTLTTPTDSKGHSAGKENTHSSKKVLMLK